MREVWYRLPPDDGEPYPKSETCDVCLLQLRV